ncbi:MAG: hypothetical protein JJE50_14270 [Actinomycetales bacterium]|nr:hypothetical protein [Actinomycetales bacterium]
MDLTQLGEEIEQISQIYADKFGIERDGDWFLLKLQEEVGELTQAYLMASGRARDKGHSADELRERLHAETADVLCHVLLLARHHGVDLEAAIDKKWLSWHR